MEEGVRIVSRVPSGRTWSTTAKAPELRVQLPCWGCCDERQEQSPYLTHGGTLDKLGMPTYQGGVWNVLWRVSWWNEVRLPGGCGTWCLEWDLENRISVGRDSQRYSAQKCGKVKAHSGCHLVETWGLPAGAVKCGRLGSSQP